MTWVRMPRGRWIESEFPAHNPTESWWTRAQRDDFSKVCAREWERMRWSKFGNRQTSPEKPGMGTIEMYRAKRAMQSRVGTS